MTENPKETIVYSDVDSEDMRRKRRRDITMGYAVFIVLLSVFSILCLASLIRISSDSLQTAFSFGVIWMIILPVAAWLLWYVFISNQKIRLEHGIVLTDRALLLFESEIPLKDILRVEVVRFTSEPRTLFLAIDYKTKGKVATRLLWPKDAEDIHELSDMIRRLKGWPRQETISWRKWREWKRTRKSLLASCTTPPD
ncbi:MAG: hypothetical protein KAU99_04110 [Thermoplasmata archaeon]|nr:hypothetical protein [Thermoplasmata archaeon]